MASTSLSEQARDLVAQTSGIIAACDIDSLAAADREVLATIKRRLGDIRLDVRDYEYAETRAEQTAHGREARTRLAALQKDILQASQSGLFSAIDVAQLTAKAEHIVQQLT